jgi:hypothetical protein
MVPQVRVRPLNANLGRVTKLPSSLPVSAYSLELVFEENRCFSIVGALLEPGYS